MLKQISQRDIDGFPRWTWMNNGISADYLEVHPNKTETLNCISKALRQGEEYAKKVMLFQTETSGRCKRFEKAMRWNNVSTTRRYQCSKQK